MNNPTQPLVTPAASSFAGASVGVDSAPEQPPIPKWVGVMVAVALLGSLVGGGGLWAWSFYSRPDPKNLVEVGPNRSLLQRAVISAPRPPQYPSIAPGISQLSSTTYQVTSGEFSMFAGKTLLGNDWNLRLLYSKPDLVTADQKAALFARVRLGSDPLFAKSLDVSDEQVTKLKGIPLLNPNNPSLTISPGDTEKLKIMWVGLISSKPAKPADAAALLGAVQEIGKASLVETRKTIADAVQQIQQTITSQQIAGVNGGTTGK